MNALGAILLKDLVTELRLRHVLPTMFVLALVLVTVFGIVADRQVQRSSETTAGILWVAFAFAGLLAVERAFASEKEGRTMAGLLAAPVSPQTIFVAKCAASAVMLLVVQAFTLPVAVLFFEYALAGPPLPLLAVLLLGDAALVLVGTFAGAMVAAARSRGPLLAVLALPLLIPVLIFSAACTAELVARGWTEQAAIQMLILAAFDVCFGAAVYLLFPYVLEA